MAMNQSSIFRQRALEQYEKGRETAVLPRLVQPRFFIVLWTVLILVIVGLSFSWFWSVPVYASGMAVVTDAEPENGLQLTVFFPATNEQPFYSVRQLFVQLENSQRIPVTVENISAEVLSPAAIQARFAGNTVVHRLVTQPAAVIEVNWETAVSDLPPDLYAGAVFPAQIEIGSVRIIQLLPTVGRSSEKLR